MKLPRNFFCIAILFCLSSTLVFANETEDTGTPQDHVVYCNVEGATDIFYYGVPYFVCGNPDLRTIAPPAHVLDMSVDDQADRLFVLCQLPDDPSSYSAPTWIYWAPEVDGSTNCARNAFFNSEAVEEGGTQAAAFDCQRPVGIVEKIHLTQIACPYDENTEGYYQLHRSS